MRDTINTMAVIVGTFVLIIIINRDISTALFKDTDISGASVIIVTSNRSIGATGFSITIIIGADIVIVTINLGVTTTKVTITTVISASVRIIALLLLIDTAFNLIAIFVGASIVIITGRRIVHTSDFRVTQISSASIVIIARDSRIITTSIRVTRKAITERNEARHLGILTTIFRTAIRNQTFVGGGTSIADIIMHTSIRSIAGIFGTSVFIVTTDFFMNAVTSLGITPIRGAYAVIIAVH